MFPLVLFFLPIEVHIVDATNISSLPYCILKYGYDLTDLTAALEFRYGEPISDQYYPISKSYAKKRVLKYACNTSQE